MSEECDHVWIWKREVWVGEAYGDLKQDGIIYSFRDNPSVFKDEAHKEVIEQCKKCGDVQLSSHSNILRREVDEDIVVEPDWTYVD